MLTYAAIFALLVVAIFAEPPRINSKFSKEFQQVEEARSQPVRIRQLPGQFILLQRVQSVPQAAQPSQDEAIQHERDQPNISTRVPVKNITGSEPEQRNSTEKEEKNEKLTEAKEEQGVYYIYHPNGLLQKVVYATNDDVQNMAFSARLRYQNVEPIREPIYTYDPETFVFKRI